MTSPGYYKPESRAFFSEKPLPHPSEKPLPHSSEKPLPHPSPSTLTNNTVVVSQISTRYLRSAVYRLSITRRVHVSLTPACKFQLNQTRSLSYLYISPNQTCLPNTARFNLAPHTPDFLRRTHQDCAVARAQHLGQNSHFAQQPPRGWLRSAQPAVFGVQHFSEKKMKHLFSKSPYRRFF